MFVLLMLWGLMNPSLGTLTQTTAPVSLFNGYSLLGVPREMLKQIAISTAQTILNTGADANVDKDLRELLVDASNWHYPLEPHVTTKYWGSTMPVDPQEIQEYKAFKEDIKTSIRFPVVCYAVGGLSAMPAFMDKTQTPQSNRFPHTTVVTGSLAAQYSNDLISVLYDQEPEFAQNYETEFNQTSQIVYKYTVTINKQQFTAYVVVLPSVLWTNGSTRRFYIS